MRRLLALALCLACLPLSQAMAARLGPAEKLESGQILRGRFTESHPIKGFSAPLQSEGHFVVAPDQGVIWSIEKPMAMNVVITPRGMANFVGGVPVMNLSSLQNPFLAKATFFLTAALGGHLQQLEKDFSITQSGTPNAWTTILVPKTDEGSPFSRLVAAGGKTVTAAKAIGRSGREDTFAFSDQIITREPLTAAEAALFETSPTQK